MKLKTFHTALTVALLALALSPMVDIESPWTRQKTKPDKSQGAVVSQQLGVESWVQIAYHRPAMRGRDVWTAKNQRGQLLVPRGDTTPWRAGANEATTIEFSRSAWFEGHEVDAGKYALYMIPGDESWTLILQSFDNQWGAGGYDKANDIVRATVVPQTAPESEWLTYGFTNCEDWTAMAYLHWGRVKVPFEVGVNARRQPGGGQPRDDL